MNVQPFGTSTGFMMLSTALKVAPVSVPLKPGCWVGVSRQILVKVSVPAVAYYAADGSIDEISTS